MNTLNALHVAHNDEHHDYSKSGFVCHLQSHRDALLIENAEEAIGFVRAFSLLYDELPGDEARRVKLQADSLLRRVDRLDLEGGASR